MSSLDGVARDLELVLERVRRLNALEGRIPADGAIAYKDLALFVRETRVGRGQSLREAAAEMGIDNSYLSVVERGIQRNVTADVLERVARWLGVPIVFRP